MCDMGSLAYFLAVNAISSAHRCLAGKERVLVSREVGYGDGSNERGP